MSLSNVSKLQFGLIKQADITSMIGQGAGKVLGGLDWLKNRGQQAYSASRQAAGTGMDWMKDHPGMTTAGVGTGATGGYMGLKKVFDHRTPMQPPAAPGAPGLQSQGTDWSSLLRNGASAAEVPTMLGAGIGGLGGLLGGGGVGGTLGGAAQGATTGLGFAGGSMGGNALASSMGIQDPTARLLFGLGGGALGGYLGNRVGGMFNHHRNTQDE